MGLKDRLKKYDFTKFVPGRLLGTDVDRIYKRCFEDQEYECAGIYVTFTDEERLFINFGNLYHRTRTILYMFGQLKIVHDGVKEFELGEMSYNYKGKPWAQNVQNIMGLLYLGIASGILEPYTIKERKLYTRFRFDVVKTYDSEDAENYNGYDEQYWSDICPEQRAWYMERNDTLLEKTEEVFKSVSEDIRTLQQLDPKKVNYYYERTRYMCNLAYLRYKALIKPEVDMTLEQLLDNYTSISAYGKNRVWEAWNDLPAISKIKVQNCILMGSKLSARWEEYDSMCKADQNIMKLMTIDYFQPYIDKYKKEKPKGARYAFYVVSDLKEALESDDLSYNISSKAMKKHFDKIENDTWDYTVRVQLAKQKISVFDKLSKDELDGLFDLILEIYDELDISTSLAVLEFYDKIDWNNRRKLDLATSHGLNWRIETFK